MAKKEKIASISKRRTGMGGGGWEEGGRGMLVENYLRRH